MKKLTYLYVMLLLISLCGCEKNTEQTRFVLDTVAKITADCDEETLSGAFSLCEEYENLLSRTVNSSDVYRLNSASDFVEVSDSTAEIIDRALFYSELSGGKFDITVCSVSELWDFKNQIIPNRNEIAEALKNVDYESIETGKNKVNLNGKKIDLGAIAKGYIADRIKEYLIENGTEKAIINLGGNIVAFGEEYKIGIQKPFSGDNAAILCIENMSVVTSGIYQRYIEENGKIYHHIIDPTTGYGVENELASVTVIGKSSLECDALSTVCMLLGTEKGMEIIENTPATEAVFISREGSITLTEGIIQKKGMLYLNLK